MKYEDKVQKLIDDVKADLKKHNAKLRLSKTYQVKSEGMGCSGYYDSDTKTLAVATKKPLKDWLSTFIHEYCHFRQHMESIPIWNKYEANDAGQFADWLSNSQIPSFDKMKEIADGVKITAALELDCEKRTVKMIKKYKLESIIPIDEYTQKSIAYVLFYKAMLNTRQWYKSGREPYAMVEAYGKMPKTFKGLRLFNKKLVEIIQKTCLE